MCHPRETKLIMMMMMMMVVVVMMMMMMMMMMIIIIIIIIIIVNALRLIDYGSPQSSGNNERYKFPLFIALSAWQIR